MPRRVLRALVVPALALALLGTSLLTGPATGSSGGRAPTPHANRLDADYTLQLRDLFLARPTMAGLGRRVADGLLARPTDGAADPFGDEYTAPSTRTCGPHVCVHWVRRTDDAPASRRWVDTTLRVMEQVWRHHVVRLGYRRPATDGRRGGDARFDVYLKEIGQQGLYGYCAPERRVAGHPLRAVGFCVLDDDFARDQFARPPMQSLRVTASHEFFHAIQFSYDFAEDPWLLESTATWMEEQFADAVDDNRSFLRYGQLARPGVPLDRFDTAGLGHYGNWTLWQFLADRLGPDVVRRVIEQTPRRHSVAALRRVLGSRGGLGALYAAYASGNTVPGGTYPEGATYPRPYVGRQPLGPRVPRARVAMRLDHLTARSIRLVPSARLDDARTRLRVSVLAPRRAAAAVLVRRTDGSLKRRPIRLDDRGDGAVVLPFSARTTDWVTVTVANVSTRYRCGRGTVFACHGVARDDDRRFVVEASLQ